MAYSADLRKRVIEYLREGHTQEETSAIFKVGTTTIKEWLALLSETGSLEKRPLKRVASKFESEKLNAYVEENPNALLKDIAEYFGGSTTGAFYALEREKLTYKKKRFTIKNGTKRNGKHLLKS